MLTIDHNDDDDDDDKVGTCATEISHQSEAGNCDEKICAPFYNALIQASKRTQTQLIDKNEVPPAQFVITRKILASVAREKQ